MNNGKRLAMLGLVALATMTAAAPFEGDSEADPNVPPAPDRPPAEPAEPADTVPRYRAVYRSRGPAGPRVNRSREEERRRRQAARAAAKKAR